VGDKRSAYRVVVERLKGKRPFGRPRLRCEDDITVDLRKWDVEA
jgi:hypothetical protein